MSLRINVQRETFPGEAYLYGRDIGCCGHREYRSSDDETSRKLSESDVASESLPGHMQKTEIPEL